MPGIRTHAATETLPPPYPQLPPPAAGTSRFPSPAVFLSGPYFRVLGPVRVERHGRPVPLGRPQARAVLAILLLARGRMVSIERLIDDLWGDAPPPSARVQLQGHISGLRRALGARGALDPTSPIVTEPSGYRLQPPEGHLDLDRFTFYLAEARRLLSAGNAWQAGELLRTGLALWEEEPFADVDLPAVRDAAAYLAELRLAALEERIRAELTCGLQAQLIPELRQLVLEHPFRERLWAQLLTALSGAGRTAEALTAYRQVWRMFDTELGIEPSSTLQQLHLRLLNGEPPCPC